MILHGLRADDEIPQKPRVWRRHGANRVLYGANRCDGVDSRADAADALRKSPCIPRIASFQDELDSPKHRA